jgi:hypothetical protein
MAEAEAPTALVEMDWVAVGLGLLAFTSVIGLIPFGIWVFTVFNPPIP